MNTQSMSNEDRLVAGIREAGRSHRNAQGQFTEWSKLVKNGIRRESGDPGKSGRFGIYSRAGNRIASGIWAGVNANGTVDVELQEGVRYTVTVG